MNEANFGKRLLYGFAAGLFGPAVILYIAFQFAANLPLWFWVLMPFVCIASFWFGYKFPSNFEETFQSGLEVAARQNPQQLGVGVQSLRKVDMQRKMPKSLGWFLFLLFLICLILIFTRYVEVVPYLFGGDAIIFLIFYIVAYYKNKNT